MNTSLGGRKDSWLAYNLVLGSDILAQVVT